MNRMVGEMVEAAGAINFRAGKPRRALTSERTGNRAINQL